MGKEGLQRGGPRNGDLLTTQKCHTQVRSKSNTIAMPLDSMNTCSFRVPRVAIPEAPSPCPIGISGQSSTKLIRTSHLHTRPEPQNYCHIWTEHATTFRNSSTRREGELHPMSLCDTLSLPVGLDDIYTTSPHFHLVGNKHQCPQQAQAPVWHFVTLTSKIRRPSAPNRPQPLIQGPLHSRVTSAPGRTSTSQP